MDNVWEFRPLYLAEKSLVTFRVITGNLTFPLEQKTLNNLFVCSHIICVFFSRTVTFTFYSLWKTSWNKNIFFSPPLPLPRRHSLWTAPKIWWLVFLWFLIFYPCKTLAFFTWFSKDKKRLHIENGWIKILPDNDITTLWD